MVRTAATIKWLKWKWSNYAEALTCLVSSQTDTLTNSELVSVFHWTWGNAHLLGFLLVLDTQTEDDTSTLMSSAANWSKGAMRATYPGGKKSRVAARVIRLKPPESGTRCGHAQCPGTSSGASGSECHDVCADRERAQVHDGKRPLTSSLLGRAIRLL